MTVGKGRKLRDALLIAGFIIALLGYFWDLFGIIGIIIMFSGLIPHFLYNKCPHCGKQLGRNEGDYCQFCGKSLEEDKNNA